MRNKKGSSNIGKYCWFVGDINQRYSLVLGKIIKEYGNPSIRQDVLYNISGVILETGKKMIFENISRVRFDVTDDEKERINLTL